MLKKLFRKKPKFKFIENEFTIVEAFRIGKDIYYMHADPLNTATGRGLSAMVYLDELLMRCDAEYLKWHIEAVDKIFSDGKKIDLPTLIKLHSNLKERVNLMIALPKHVYKLASVVFFTDKESPYRYDEAYNKKKIEVWEKTDGMYDFFLRSPLKALVPFLALPAANTEAYLKALDKIDRMHIRDLREALSSNALTAASKN